MNKDFSGLATVYEVPCTDGRVIQKGAFDHQFGETVPLVWRHGHGDVTNIIGHGILGPSDDPSGVRVTGAFNKTKEGLRAKKLVMDKDIDRLSIWANEVIEHQNGSGDNLRRVVSGTIREVSLVMFGANPGARIDDLIRHEDDMVYLDGVIVHTDSTIEVIEEEPEEPEEEPEEPKEPEETVEHEDSDPTVREIIASLDENQKMLFGFVVHSALNGIKVNENQSNGSGGPTVKEVFDTLTDQQKEALYFVVGELTSDEPTISQEDLGLEQEEVTTMNIFEANAEESEPQGTVLSHESVLSAINEARSKRVSLRSVFDNRGITISHSITDIDSLFPDAKQTESGGPRLHSRPMEWVEKVLGGTSNRPFARVKSRYADITADEARAKGYVTGDEKVEEVIAVLGRETTPQTIYKLQKLDRDDVIDITDFDIVMWLKAEMRLMLREELARAILVGDGRDGADAEKIKEDKIRPIATDSSVYTVPMFYNDVGNEKAVSAMTDEELLDLIDFIAGYSVDYRGSGSPTLYAAPDFVNKLMMIRDADGRRIHRSRMELAEALNVGGIVEVFPMADSVSSGVEDPAGQPEGAYDLEHVALIVNLSDYVIGMDRGGQTTFFDDFDIDFNQYKYLYETRLSGALVVPKSAVAVSVVTAYDDGL